VVFGDNEEISVVPEYDTGKLKGIIRSGCKCFRIVDRLLSSPSNFHLHPYLIPYPAPPRFHEDSH